MIGNLKFLVLLVLLLPSLCLAEEVLLPPCNLESDTTDLGAEILVADQPGKGSAALALAFRGGVAGEGELLGSGLSYLAGELLRQRLAALLQKEDSGLLGLRFECETTYEGVFIRLEGPRESLEKACPPVFELLSSLKPSKKEFAELRSRLAKEARLSEKDQGTALLALWNRVAFGGSPLAAPIIGFSSQQERLELIDLQEYLGRHLVSGNARAVLSGSIFGGELEKTVRSGIESLPKGVLMQRPNLSASSMTPNRFASQKSDESMSLVCLGLTLPCNGAANLACAQVGERLLKAQSGLLEKELASQFRAQIGVQAECHRKGPVFALTFQVESLPAECQKVRQLMEEWLKSSLQKNFSGEEVQAVSQDLVRSLCEKAAEPASLADFLVRGSLLEYNPYSYQELARELQALDSGKIRDYLRACSSPQNLVAVWSDPREKEEEGEDFLKQEREILEGDGYACVRRSLPGGGEMAFQKRDDVTTVRLAFAFLGGNWCEVDYNNGIFAVLTEFLVQGGGHGNELSKALKKSGAKLEPLSSPQYFGFVLSVPSDRLYDVLPFAVRSFASPKINADTLQQAREAALGRLMSQTTNNQQSAEMLATEALFRNHPFGFNRFGNPFVMERMEVRDLDTICREYITCDNLEIVLSGPAEEKKFLLAVFAEGGEYFSKKPDSARILHRATKPRILPEQAEPQPIEKHSLEFTAPRQDAFLVAALALPGNNRSKDAVATPFLLDQAFCSALEPTLEKIRLEFGPRSVLDSGHARYFGFDQGYAYLWTSVRPECAEKARKWLQEGVAASLKSLKEKEGLERAVNLSSALAPQFGRDQKSFVSRSIGHCLFTTNAWTDIKGRLPELTIGEMEQVLPGEKGPVFIYVRPEN